MRTGAIGIFVSVGLLSAHASPSPSPSTSTSTSERAREVLFEDEKSAPSCDSGTNDERVRCLVDARYAADERSRALARALFDATGSVAGVEPPDTFHGGFRG